MLLPGFCQLLLKVSNSKIPFGYFGIPSGQLLVTYINLMLKWSNIRFHKLLGFPMQNCLTSGDFMLSMLPSPQNKLLGLLIKVILKQLRTPVPFSKSNLGFLLVVQDGRCGCVAHCCSDLTEVGLLLCKGESSMLGF